MSRSGWYQLVLFLHVLGAIAAIGPTLTYGPWITRTERHRPEMIPWVLHMVHWVDRRVATPAFLAQALSGTGLVVIGRWDFWGTGWLLASIGIYAVAFLGAVSLVGPLSRRRLALALAGGTSGAPDVQREYVRVSVRLRRATSLVAVATVAIVYLMVTKPAL